MRFRITSTAWSSIPLFTSLSPPIRRIRNEVPPWISRPSWIFSFGGQMVAMLNATSNMTSVVASTRFRRPTSVAKYHANKTSRPRPAKNVRPGLISLSCRAKSRHLLLFQLFRLQNSGDRRFFHLDLHVIGHVRDQPVNPRVRHHPVACF